MLIRVPEVTAFFWIIAVLCTTVGETVAEFLVSGRDRTPETAAVG